MRISKRQLRKIIREVISLDLRIDDVILGGKFKNKRIVVKEIGEDEYGHPTVNGKSILRFKIEKLLPKTKWSKVSKESIS